METIRNLIPADARAAWYAVSSAVVSALVAWGVLEEAAAPAVTGVVIAAVTLIFALVHSTSPWRQALYGFAAALAILGTYLGWGTEMQMGALVSIVASVLGIGTAAATTNPDQPDQYAGAHRLEN